jgi:hypothetical protein
MTKTEQVLWALKDGQCLTALDAQRLCNTMRLASIVHRLRKRGHPIHSRDVRIASGVIVSEYSYGDGSPGSHLRCASGQHTWLDPVDRRRCCNGFVRLGRPENAPMLVGEVSGGEVLTDEGFLEVWVRRG